MDRMHIGSAMFDDALNTGWACVDGSSPFSITSLADLPTNTLWVTSCSRKDLVLAEMSECDHIAGKDYFSVSVDLIIIELGLYGTGKEDQSRILAAVFSRILRFGQLFLSAPISPKKFAIGVGGRLRGHDIEVQADVSEMLHSLSKGGGISTSALGTLAEKEVIVFTLPRHSVAANMLTIPRPAGRLKQVSEGAHLPPSDRVQWVSEQAKCVLCEVDISNISQSHLDLFNLSQGERPETASLRSYKRFVTGPELVCLDSISDVFVRNIYLADLDTGRDKNYPMQTGRGFQVSYSYGLFIKNVWMASVYPNNRFNFPCAASSWLMGSLRARALSDALNMQEALPSFSVQGMLCGQIVAHVDSADMARAVSLGISAGYIPFARSGHYGLDRSSGTFASAPHQILSMWASVNESERLLAEDANCLDKSLASAALRSSEGLTVTPAGA